MVSYSVLLETEEEWRWVVESLRIIQLYVLEGVLMDWEDELHVCF
jgi:hypothetical protein